MTDQEIREAREWAEYITAVPELYGTFASQASAAARFILDNTDPPLPDPLFLAKATHPDHGEGVVGSYHPDMGGVVRFMVPNSGSIDGTGTFWLNPRTLKFHTPDTPDHPEFLETEEDYENAPDGTIVSEDDVSPAVRVRGHWRFADSSWTLFHEEMAGNRRRVLRWGWGA